MNIGRPRPNEQNGRHGPDGMVCVNKMLEMFHVNHS